MRGTLMALTIAATGLGSTAAGAQTALTVAGTAAPTTLAATLADAAAWRAVPSLIAAAPALAAPLLTADVALAGASRGGDAARKAPRLVLRNLGTLRDAATFGGFHLSVGFTKRADFGRAPRMSAIDPVLRALLYSPAMSQTLRATDGIRRKLPMALAGFTEALGERASLRFDAGAMMVRGSRLGLAGDARPVRAGLGAVAQLSFLRRF